MTDFPTSKCSTRNGPPRLVVLHSAETPHGCKYAKSICSYLATSTVRASIHAAVADTCIATSVEENAAAWHAANSAVNACSLGLEQAGYAAWSREEWLSDATVHTAASVVAKWMATYGIAPVRLQGQALVDCAVRGIGSGWCTHLDVTQAFGIAGGHTDPGPGYPYDVFQAGLTGNKPTTAPLPSEEDDMVKFWFARPKSSPKVEAISDDLATVRWLKSDADARTFAYVIEASGGQILTPPPGSETMDLGGKKVWVMADADYALLKG